MSISVKYMAKWLILYETSKKVISHHKKFVIKISYNFSHLSLVIVDHGEFPFIDSLLHVGQALLAIITLVVHAELSPDHSFHICDITISAFNSIIWSLTNLTSIRLKFLRLFIVNCYKISFPKKPYRSNLQILEIVTSLFFCLALIGQILSVRRISFSLFLSWNKLIETLL